MNRSVAAPFARLTALRGGAALRAGGLGSSTITTTMTTPMAGTG